VDWLRLYADAVDNAKLRLISPDDRWYFLALCCCKAQGVFDEADDEFRRRSLCVKLGLDALALGETIERLRKVKLVAENGHPLKWSDRQFLSDSSTERTRRYRERHGNVTVTPQNRTEQNREEGAGAPGLDVSAWEKWIAYRVSIRKPLKPVSHPAAQKEMAALGPRQMASVDHSMANGWTGLFAPKNDPKKGKTVAGFEGYTF
jgi:hypothetical protein